jgi:hypothetical protein
VGRQVVRSRIIQAYQGFYSINLKFSPQNGVSAAPVSPDDPPIFVTALEEQLG